jgi:hypothetical protein
MDSWFVRDRKEAWKKKCMEKLGRDHFFPKDIWESIDDMNSVDRNEHIKQYYNVYVYRVLDRKRVV